MGESIIYSYPGVSPGDNAFTGSDRKNKIIMVSFQNQNLQFHHKFVSDFFSCQC